MGVLALSARWAAWAAVVLSVSFLAACGAGFVAVFVVAKDWGAGPPVFRGTFVTLVVLQVCASWLLRNRGTHWILSGAVTVVALTVTGALVCVPLLLSAFALLRNVSMPVSVREWVTVAVLCMPILGALVGAGLGVWLTRRQRRARGRGRAAESVGPAPSPVSAPE